MQKIIMKQINEPDMSSVTLNVDTACQVLGFKVCRIQAESVSVDRPWFLNVRLTITDEWEEL